MLDKFQTMALALLNSLDSAVRAGRIGDERGQTATEYVGMTAAGLLVAITVVWALLGNALATGISTMGNKLINFVGP